MRKEIIELWNEYLNHLIECHQNTEHYRTFDEFMFWLEKGFNH